MKRPQEPHLSMKCPMCGGEDFNIQLTFIMDFVPDSILEYLLRGEDEVMVAGPVRGSEDVVVTPEERGFYCPLEGKIALDEAVRRVVYCNSCLYKPPCSYDEGKLLVMEPHLPWLVRTMHNARRRARGLGADMTSEPQG